MNKTSFRKLKLEEKQFDCLKSKQNRQYFVFCIVCHPIATTKEVKGVQCVYMVVLFLLLNIPYHSYVVCLEL